MTREQFEAKIKELLIPNEEFLMKEALRLFDSGAVDPESFGDDFILPRIIGYVALRNLADQIGPIRSFSANKGFRREIKNLERF